MTVISSLPPPIIQHFSKYLLLDAISRKKMIVDEKIIPLSHKKIRKQDVGKQREFQKLLKEFHEEYERKKEEKAIYDSALKEVEKKRPCIPTSSGVAIFKRHKR